MVTIENLQHALEKSWSTETSFLPTEWSLDNPARGQCAVTALVIQDYLGGDILKCDVVEESDAHFYNRLPNGHILDCTKVQFAPNRTFIKEKIADRAKMLSYPGTQTRYETLKATTADFVDLQNS